MKMSPQEREKLVERLLKALIEQGNKSATGLWFCLDEHHLQRILGEELERMERERERLGQEGE